MVMWVRRSKDCGRREFGAEFPSLSSGVLQLCVLYLTWQYDFAHDGMCILKEVFQTKICWTILAALGVIAWGVSMMFLIVLSADQPKNTVGIVLSAIPTAVGVVLVLAICLGCILACMGEEIRRNRLAAEPNAMPPTRNIGNNGYVALADETPV
jgi:hypothetical protein